MKLFKTPTQAAICLYLIGIVIVFGNIFFGFEYFYNADIPRAILSGIGFICGIWIICFTFILARKL